MAALLIHLFDKVIQVTHFGFLAGDFPAIDVDRLDEHRQLADELHGLLGGGLITQDMEGGAQDDSCGGDVFFVSKLCGNLLDEVLTAAGVFFKIHIHSYRNLGSHGHRMLRGFCGRLPCSCERFLRGNLGCSPAWDAYSF